MSVGYAPDTFGHVAQLPQILRGFGVDALVFWRGLGEEADRLGAVFLWEGLDGSRLVAVCQLLGYGNACQWGHDQVWDGRPPRGATAVRQLRTLWERTAAIRARTGLDLLLVGVGGDHEELDPHLARLVDECRALWPEAEFSIVVTDDYQNMGLGSELLRRLVDIGRREGVRAIIADILAENVAMQKVAEKFGFRIQRSVDEPVVSARLALQ